MVGDLPGDLAAAVALGGEMGRRFAEYDWAAHPLGPPSQWPADIRATVAVALTSRFPIVLWLGGQDLFHVYNDGYIPMLGDKHPAALGTPARDVWWEIWPQIGPMLGGVIKTGEATWSDDLMLALVTAGRPQERFFTFSYGPIMSGDGRVGGVFCAVSETTERVLGERRLQVLTTAATALMETRTVDEAVRATVQACGDGHPDLPFIAIYVDEDSGATRLRGASPQVMGLLPATLDRLTTTPDVDYQVSHIDDPGSKIQVAGDLGTTVPELPSVFGEDCPERALVIALTDAGPESVGGFLVVGLNPLRPLDDQYRGFCLLLADQVSSAFATASSYEQERRRADALAELDQVKSAFLTNVSHEFRTPLTLLMGPLDDAITDTRGETVQSERLETARRNAGRLLRLVTSLLEFSRVEAGRAEVSLVIVDLGALTAQVASSFTGLCERAGIELVLDCDPVTAEVDVTMWETIVLNLLSNAVKFTFDGSITVQVSRAPSEGGRLRVVDTGSGIPEAELGRLFDRFYRASNIRGRSVEGSGIGLSLVRSLTELNNGTVHIDSAVDVGTTVTIDLPPVRELRADAVPLAQVAGDGHPASDSYVAEAMQWLDVEPADLPPWSARDERSRPLVLIADDNPDMRRYLRRILSQRWDSVMFGDGRTALEGARRHRPDLVVTDVMMPELDGFGLVAAIRDDPDLASTPVLMLSARAGPEAAGEGYAVGADDYLTKPFTSQELVNRVEARLSGVGRHRADREHDDAQSRRDAMVAEVTATLSAAESTESALAAVLATPAASLGATGVAIGVLDPAEGHLTVHYAGDISAEVRDRYHRMALDAPVPIAEVTRTGQPMVIPDTRMLDARLGGVVRDEPRVRAAVIQPLRDNTDTVIGVVALLWPAPQVFGQAELGLIDHVSTVTGLAMARIRAAEREHRIATDFQDQLLDLDQSSRAVVVGAVYQPAAEAMRVGGDWYLVAPLDDERVGVCVGDVVGHGLAAATVMGRLRAAVAATALSSGDPHHVLATVQRYATTVAGARCTTLAYATLNTKTSTLQHLCAGHPYPLLVQPDGTTRFLRGGRLPPIAAMELSADQPPESSELTEGDLLILYTDGLIERYGESLDVGLKRLAAAAATCAKLPVDAVCSTLLEHQAPSGGYTDDVAILAVRPTGTTDTTFAAVLPADPLEMVPVREGLRRWLERLDLDETLTYRVTVGVGEALANAIEHGSALDAGRTVSVEAFASPDTIRATVSDTGQWIGDSAASYRIAERGRGLALINGLSERVDTVRTARGTHVTVQYSRSQGIPTTGARQ